jgi:hypothetical protein
VGGVQAVQIALGSANGGATEVGNGVDGIFVWGAQLEVSVAPTVYQPKTVNAVVTPSFRRRITNNGAVYVTSQFDEWTGTPIVDSSLKLWIDSGQATSYPGSGATWTDLSSTGNNLTLTNAPVYNNILGGGAITFDGTNNFAVKTTSVGIPTGSNPFTLSAWFYPTSSATSMRVVAYGVENNGQLVSIRLNSGSAYAVSFAHWGGTGYDVGNGSTVNGNAWNNVTEVYDGINDYMYINGILVGTFTPLPLSIPANSDLYVGKRATGEFFAGSVGQVMLYNRALVTSEVTQNFTALRRRYGI